MNPIFKKLNYKDQELICVLNAPESFASNLAKMEALTKIDIKYYKSKIYPFLLFFAKNEQEFKTIAKKVSPTLEMDLDIVFWVAYPKKSSKKYNSNINRDSDNWLFLGKMGFEGVRAVAIDEDWSALRFRKAKFIKSMTRSKLRKMSTSTMLSDRTSATSSNRNLNIHNIHSDE